ncbi:MAG: UDP-N-acetylmuramate dehydrogenase [Acidimicrobiia bacterium]|nr:UDP-N-acetylmuramate dehydrogenase [Acidimicrobiia bacterium]
MTGMADLVGDGIVRTDVVLGPLTTYKLGGAARYFSEPPDLDTLIGVLGAASDEGVPTAVLGRGSNMVIADAGFDGLVIRLSSGFNEITHRPDSIQAGAAVSLPVLARSAVAEGRLGLEFYVGIPGSVGGAVRQNAGCHGTETRDVLCTATVVTSAGRVDNRDGEALELSYRHSNLKDDEVVVAAAFCFEEGAVDAGEAKMREVIRWRREHQPGGTLNAGSVFKNPPGDSAGRLIDSLGLKGMSVGGASVSTRHANFFVAEGNATAQDIFDLVRLVRTRVRSETGVDLSPEIRFVGFTGESP